MGDAALQEKEVGELIPVDGATRVGINLQEELRHIGVAQRAAPQPAAAQVRPQLGGELLNVQLTAAIFIGLLLQVGGSGK